MRSEFAPTESMFAREPMTSFRVVGVDDRSAAGFLQVERLTIEDDAGGRHPRVVVRHPGAVVIVPVTEDRRAVVLVRQYRAAVDDDLLEVPAGKRDVAGEPAEETARRELLEEVGLVADRLVFLASVLNSPGFCDERSEIFAALGCRPGAGRAPVGPEETAMTIESLLVDEVEEAISRGRIRHATSVIGLLLTAAWLRADSTAAG